MTPELEKYLEEIGSSDVSVRRVRLLIDTFSELLPTKIEQIFVADHLDAEGVRRQKALWIFTAKTVSECKNFLNETNFDMIAWPQKPTLVYTKCDNYDFRIWNDKSSLFLKASFGFEIHFEMTACQNNCPHLKKVSKSLFGLLT